MPILALLLSLIFALSVSAQSPLARGSFTKGAELAKAGRFEDAARSYKRALLAAEAERIDKRLVARIRFNIGVCLYQMGRYKEAVPEYDAAIRLAEGDYPRYSTLSAWLKLPTSVGLKRGGLLRQQ